MSASVCPFCLTPGLAPFGVKDGFRVARCAACGTGIVERPAELDPTAQYKTGYHRKSGPQEASHGWDDYDGERPSIQRTFADRLAALGRFSPGGDLLDVGCGPGFFLELARERYKRVAGVELGKEAVAQAKENGLDVREVAFGAGLFAPASFDAITLFDTIEHLSDPVGALEAARDLLRPSGVLMISTGDFTSAVARLSGMRWHLMTPPEHLFFLSQAGLRAALERLGLRVEWVGYPHGFFSLDYLLEKSSKILKVGGGYRDAQALRRQMRRVVIPLNLWDIMVVVARKAA